jgi:hypothetical protein
MHQIAKNIPSCHKNTKWPENIPTSLFFKIYPNWEFRFTKLNHPATLQQSKSTLHRLPFIRLDAWILNVLLTGQKSRP